MRVSSVVSALLWLISCSGPPLSPLIRAARSGDAGGVRRLTSAGANPNITGGVNGWTVLMHAIHKRQNASMMALLDAGANPNARTGSGQTALIMAAGYGYTDMVKTLLARGADPRLTVPGGGSALEAAVTGTPDLDRFTLGNCQAATVRALLDNDPGLTIRAGFWGSLARRTACAETAKLLASNHH